MGLWRGCKDCEIFQRKSMVDRTAVILTALPVEYKAVRRHLLDLTEFTHPSGTVYEIGNFADYEGQKWKTVLAEIGPGNPGAAAEIERAIATFSPEVALFVGIAGGLKDVAIGDVVVATKVYGYETGKAELEFRTRPVAFPSSYDLQQRARAEAKRENWLKRINLLVPPSFHAFVAPTAAGEKVVASRRSNIATFIADNYGDALAIEMEGRGFLEAANSNQQVHALVIRGISDLIDQKSDADASGSQELAARNASAFAFEVLAKFSQKPHRSAVNVEPKEDVSDFSVFTQNYKIEELLEPVKLGEWGASADAAIKIIGETRPDGTNASYESLLKYINSPNEDIKWAAIQTVECVLALSPDLLRRGFLIYLASSQDFSLRASAASICMELANSEPTRVPLDVLIPLSRYDEDWYVQAPANAALKAMMGTMPYIYRIFRSRLRSKNSDEREHAASALADIGRTEPEILDAEEIRGEINRLNVIHDKKAVRILMPILPAVTKAGRKSNYKYGL
jgi:nucleoside phosphorylase